MAAGDFTPRDLKFGRRSRIFWAKEAKGALAFFVHGFRGQSIGTWGDMVWKVRESSTFQGWDLVFYGYDSTQDVQGLAIDLGEAVEALDDQSPGLPNSRLSERGESAAYHKIVLVAHSMGAVVVRRALVDALATDKRWVGKAKMVFFAPAHSGATLLPLVTEAFGGFPVLPSLLKVWYTCLPDIDGYDAPCLRILRRDAEQGVAEGMSTRATGVVVASPDRVVSNAPFPTDSAPLGLVKGRSHMRMCKTDPHWAGPLEILERLV